MGLQHAEALVDKKPTQTSHHIRCPNGSTAVSTHAAKLPDQHLSDAASTVHLFPDNDIDLPLLSVGQLCDDDCSAIFTKTDFTVSKDHSGDTVMTGRRGHTTGLYMVNLPPTQTRQSNHGHANIVIRSKSQAEQVKFAVATMGSSTTTTLLKA